MSQHKGLKFHPRKLLKYLRSHYVIPMAPLGRPLGMLTGQRAVQTSNQHGRQ